MKNNGFTLIELLGVIVIIGLLSLIVTILVGGILKDSKSKLTEIQIEKLEEAAKNYYITEGMESSDFEQDNFSHCVSVNYLIENGYIDGNEISNFETGEDILGSVKINFTGKKYEYVYTDDSCSICSLVNDTGETGISVGDKYQCKVKSNMEEGFEDGYFFYVLSQNTDGTTNLIMDRNVYYDEENNVGKADTEEGLGKITWINESDYKLAGGTIVGNKCAAGYYGPVTAMNYLHKATKDWNNVPNIVINYNDEIYGGIKTTGSLTQIFDNNNVAVRISETETGYMNLKTRLSYYNELTMIGCSTSFDNPCPAWLSGYYSYSEDEPGNTIIIGHNFWTLSASDDNGGAWRFEPQFEEGTLNGDDCSIANAPVFYGVRPVITLNIDKLQNEDRF